MDKRIIKTQDAVYNAFKQLLKEKNYSQITIENILEVSKISRSTFYSHFKTKDEVLKSITNHIFGHVFSHSLSVEKTHDFSKSNIFDYNHLFTHILYHLHDEKELVQAILMNSTRDEFLLNMRNNLMPISKILIQEKFVPQKDIPLTLYTSMVTETFILVVDYWFKNNCLESPEKITNYFFNMNN